MNKSWPGRASSVWPCKALFGPTETRIRVSDEGISRVLRWAVSMRVLGYRALGRYIYTIQRVSGSETVTNAAPHRKVNRSQRIRLRIRKKVSSIGRMNRLELCSTEAMGFYKSTGRLTPCCITRRRYVHLPPQKTGRSLKAQSPRTVWYNNRRTPPMPDSCFQGGGGTLRGIPS